MKDSFWNLYKQLYGYLSEDEWDETAILDVLNRIEKLLLRERQGRLASKFDRAKRDEVEDKAKLRSYLLSWVKTTRLAQVQREASKSAHNLGVIKLEALHSLLSRQMEEARLRLRLNQDAPVLEREYLRFELGMLAAQSVTVNSQIVYRTEKQIYTGKVPEWENITEEEKSEIIDAISFPGWVSEGAGERFIKIFEETQKRYSIAQEFHDLRSLGEKYEDAAWIIYERHGVKESTLSRWTREYPQDIGGSPH